MKAFKGTFVKANGEKRTMNFIRIEDLPKGFLNENIKGENKTPKKMPDGKELVWCLDNHGFRIFNNKTLIGKLKEYKSNSL